MDLLLAKTPKDVVRDHVLPMVCKALETPAEQLQVIILVKKRSLSSLSTTLKKIVPRERRVEEKRFYP